MNVGRAARTRGLPAARPVSRSTVALRCRPTDGCYAVADQPSSFRAWASAAAALGSFEAQVRSAGATLGTRCARGELYHLPAWPAAAPRSAAKRRTRRVLRGRLRHVRAGGPRPREPPCTRSILITSSWLRTTARYPSPRYPRTPTARSTARSRGGGALARRGEALAGAGDPAQRRDPPRRPVGARFDARARSARGDASIAEHVPGACRRRRRPARRLRPNRQHAGQVPLVRRSLLAPLQAGRRARRSPAPRTSHGGDSRSRRGTQREVPGPRSRQHPLGRRCCRGWPVRHRPRQAARSGKPTSASRSTCWRCARAGSSWRSSPRTMTADAREPFERHPDMRVALSDIAVFLANWNDKATNLRRVAVGAEHRARCARVR